MKENYVKVPYEEFQNLSYRSAIYDILHDVIEQSESDYIDVNMFRKIYGFGKKITFEEAMNLAKKEA